MSHVLLRPPLNCEKLQPPKTQSVLRLRAGRALKWQWVIWSRLVENLCLFSALCRFTFCSNSFQLNVGLLNVMTSVSNLSCAYSASFGVSVYAKCFLFDSYTMCEVINLITTDTEYCDTHACRKHPGLAKIYGYALDNTPITCECTQYAFFPFEWQTSIFASGNKSAVHPKSIRRDAEQIQIKFNLKGLYPNK